MQKAKVPLTNFQFGEVSPSLISRTDTKVYTASAQKIEKIVRTTHVFMNSECYIRFVWYFCYTESFYKFQRSFFFLKTFSK